VNAPTWIPQDYLTVLIVLSLSFVVLERLRPQRPGQGFFRKDLGADVCYLIFNGHVYSLLTAATSLKVALWAQEGLGKVGAVPAAPLLDGQSFWLKFAVVLVAGDFLQWCIHNLLHRVPVLWKFHQVHHSVSTMDWAGNFRFHWMEVVVYKVLLYLPMFLVGGTAAGMAVAVVGTAWGHFNHSNLRLGLGPLAYVLNSPRMHLWHHDYTDEGAPAKNFGIVFSCWDFLFRTAYWPRERPPERIGFPGMEHMVGGFAGMTFWPFLRRPKADSAPPS